MKILKFILPVLFLSFVTGCGKKDELKTTDNQQQQQQNVQTTDGSQQNQTQNQNTTAGDKKNELGIQQGLPKDYPSDVPQPKNSKPLGSLNTSEGMTVTFESTDMPKDLVKDFGDQLVKNGFKLGEGGKDLMKDEGGMMVWNKDKREVSIMVAWDKDKKSSSFVVTYK